MHQIPHEGDHRRDPLGTADGPADAVGSVSPTAGGTGTADRPQADDVSPACPPPLSWREVIAAVDRQAERFTVPRRSGGTGRIRGVVLGSGPTIFMSGGFSGDVGLFALTAWVLREQYRCVLWEYADDCDGSRSADSGVPSGIWQYADDLLTVAEHFRSEPMLAYGVSFGALVTTAALTRSPGAFRHVVLVAPAAEYALTRRERWLLRRAVRRRFPLARLPFWRHLQSRMHGLFFPPFDHSRLWYLAANLGRTPIGVAARRMLIAAGTDLSDALAELRANDRLRLCVIAPEGEAPGIRRRREHFERLLQQHRLQERLQVEFMHTSGVYPHLTHPHRLRKLLEAFMGGRNDAAAEATTGANSP
ncbi:MAG: alpha/beta hydrolase [Planctomycetota bacterium]|nr:MAG: alpha/beta hydrolase [Planctomycetota bacterium]